MTDNMPKWLLDWISWVRIQFSSPFLFFGGPGMLSKTSCEFWDFSTTTPFSFTAVCILRTLDWFLGYTTDIHSKHQLFCLSNRGQFHCNHQSTGSTVRVMGESDGLIQTRESCIIVIVHPEAHANWTCDLHSHKHADTVSDYSHFMHRKSSGTCKQKAKDKVTYKFSHSLDEGNKI